MVPLPLFFSWTYQYLFFIPQMLAKTVVQPGALQTSISSTASVSRQVQLGADEFFLPPKAAWSFDTWSIDSFKSANEFIPLTVVNVNNIADAKHVRSVLDRYNSTDDVWTPGFAETLYIQTTSTLDLGNRYYDLGKDLSPDYNVSSILFSSTNSSNTTAAPGPYFIHAYTGNVYQAYKLYTDDSQAFIQSSYQDPYDTHHPLRAGIQSAGALTIAVPSRLYFTTTKEKPLAGLRIAVKDLYNLKGLKTSFGNRAYYEMSDIKDETAVSVQKLIDAGAVIVGKNKLSEFAFAGGYVTEHIDYLLPANPRGDGYNSPGDSSGGSAASVASYDWLDASMGSDTGGSIRGPAASNGVHGNRPSQDAVNLTGVGVLSSSMDTAGMLARDPVVWSKINKVLYADTAKGYRRFPRTVYIDYMSFSSIQGSAEQHPELAEAVQNFIESLVGISSADVSYFSLDDAWSEAEPSGLEGMDPSDIVSAIYTNLTQWEQWDTVGRDYVERYKESHGGAFPYMTPFIRDGWDNARSTMSRETNKVTLKYKEMVSEWADEEFLLSSEDSCSEAIYLYFGSPSYGYDYKPNVKQDQSNPYIVDLQNQIRDAKRDTLQLRAKLYCDTDLADEDDCSDTLAQLEAFDQWQDSSPLSPSRVASVAGLPDYVITLGSFDMGEATFSYSSLQNQRLPMAVNIMAARGCDLMIMDLVTELHKRGAIKVVNTGKEA